MTELKACPVCGSTNIAHDYTAVTTERQDDRVWQVDVCKDCTHGFINPQPGWDELAPYYAENYRAYKTSHSSVESDDATVAQARRDGTFRHVPIREGDRVLDFGCGAGYFLRIASRLGAKVKGVEPSAVAVDRARETGLDVYNGTLETFACEHPGERFDLITSNHVVEHVPDPVATLRAARNLLAEGGRVWIAVPNADCGFARSMKGHWHSADLPRHIMQFTPTSLKKAAELAGLRVESVETYSLPTALAHSVRQSLRYHYHVPVRLTQRIGWLDKHYVPKLGARLDRAMKGEAILANFRLPG